MMAIKYKIQIMQQAEPAQQVIQIPAPIQKVEHPPSNYSVTQLYMIRKQSFVYSNDLIVKRLSRSFQRVKRLKNLNKEKQLLREYEQEFSQIRRSFKKVHDLFKIGSKTAQITQRKIQKMKARAQKVKKRVNNEDNYIARQIDISKAYLKTGHQQLQSQSSSSQKNIAK